MHVVVQLILFPLHSVLGLLSLAAVSSFEYKTSSFNCLQRHCNQVRVNLCVPVMRGLRPILSYLRPFQLLLLPSLISSCIFLGLLLAAVSNFKNFSSFSFLQRHCIQVRVNLCVRMHGMRPILSYLRPFQLLFY